MKFKIILFLLLIVSSCRTFEDINLNSNNIIIEKFSNSGFALIYSDNLYNEGVISKKMNVRDLLIFQKNLKKGTSVKITNPFNDKTILAKVGVSASYPKFNNSVVSVRIADELELDPKEPFIFINEVVDNNSFIAKKTKTFDEEKKVADKAPVDSISINDLNENEEKIIVDQKNNKLFNYSIKIADFYYLSTANIMAERIKSEIFLKNVEIKKLSEKNYRVLVGPFLNINSLQKAYNSVNKLQFENIEIIRND